MQPETLAGRLINQQDAKNGEDDTDE
jgi:hypothetical protein